MSSGATEARGWTVKRGKLPHPHAAQGWADGRRAGQTGQVASGRRRGLLLASVFRALETVRESWVAAKGVEA